MVVSAMMHETKFEVDQIGADQMIIGQLNKIHLIMKEIIPRVYLNHTLTLYMLR